MTEAAFAPVLAQISALVSSTRALAEFAQWEPPAWTERAPLLFPSVQKIAAWIVDEAPSWTCLAQAAPFAEWRQSYTSEEVGETFLANYAYSEIVGPQGHFFSDSLRAYIAWWGAELDYPSHAHEAEEIYCILAGHAQFRADGLPEARLGPGDTRVHAPWQRHAMNTTDSPVLTLVLWRGEGLNGLPELSEA